jgi:MFS family permease
MIAIWGTYYAFGVFFKPVLTEFGWTRAMTSGAFSLSLLVHGLLGVVMGGLTDRFGPRVVMTLSGFLLGLGYLLTSQISAVWQLYLFYGLIIGAGMGGSFVPPVSMVARWFTTRRSMMTGIVLAGTGIGALVAAPAANRLIATFDWRSSYIILGSIVLIVVVLVAQLLRRDPTQMGQVPYGENAGREQRMKLETKAFSLKEAVYTRQFWVASTMLFCFGFSMFAVMVHIVAHATEIGISAASAANLLATIGGLSIVGRVLLGSAADRIGNRQVFIIGFILMSAALFWLVPATEVWMLYVFAVAFGFAQGGMGAAESPLVAWLFGLRSHGLIFGVIGLGFTTGAAISPFLAGYIFDVTGSYQAAFLVSAVIGFLGLILAVLLTPTKTS